MEFLKGLNQATAFGISKDLYLDIWRKEMDLKLQTTVTATQKTDLSMVSEQLQKFSEEQQKLQEQQQDMLKQQREILTKVGQIQTTGCGYKHPVSVSFKEDIENEVSKLLENLSRVVETNHNHSVENFEKMKSDIVAEIGSKLNDVVKTAMESQGAKACKVCDEKAFKKDNIISALRTELDQLGSDIVFDTFDRVQEELKQQFCSNVEKLKTHHNKAMANICSEVTRQVEIGVKNTLAPSNLATSQSVKKEVSTDQEALRIHDTGKHEKIVSDGNKSQFEINQKTCAGDHKKTIASQESVGCTKSDVCSADEKTGLKKEQGQGQVTEPKGQLGKAFASSSGKLSQKFCSAESLSNPSMTAKTSMKGKPDPFSVSISFDWKINSISSCWKKMTRKLYNLELVPGGYKVEVKAVFQNLKLEFYLAALTGKNDKSLHWPATFRVKTALKNNVGMSQALGYTATFRKPQPENGRTAPVLISSFFFTLVKDYVMEDTLLAGVSIETTKGK